MTNFRTAFEIAPASNKIDYHSSILSLGSCFSENIGEKLLYYKFNINANPFGILYNPESIANSLDLLLENKPFTESGLFEHHGIWNSFYHHSRFSNTDKTQCLEKINTTLLKAAEQLNKTNFLLLTFGSSWVYQLKQTSQIVSNCHKIPAKEFNRFQLSVSEIVDRYKYLIKQLRTKNPTLQIVFTVSPVRHLKDGASENQLSKATLIMAVHQLISELENTRYFPSYEIMMDDLRDYRFYNADMVHPSPLAIEYIWDKFYTAYMPNTVQKLMPEIDKIKLALNHRPFQQNSESHQKFLKSTLNKIMETEKNNEALDFELEKQELKRQLI